MKRIILIGLLLFVGCKGPQGEKGPAGPGRVSVISGYITSDDQFIYDSRLTPTNSLTVYVGPDGVQWVEAPIYSPPSGINTGYILTPGRVELFNAYSTGSTRYNIVVVTQNAPAASMQDRLLGLD